MTTSPPPPIRPAGSVRPTPPRPPPRPPPPEPPVRDRIRWGRGLDDAVRRMRAAEHEMGSDDPTVRERAMRRYQRAHDELDAGGGYAAETEALQIAQSLGIADRLMDQPLRT